MKKPIYIFSDGNLKRKDNTIYFENEDGKKYVPVENTSQIYVFGEVNVNKRFLEFLTQSEIVLHFFNRYGYYAGTYYPREHLNSGYMILKQAEYYLDFEKRLDLAKKIVEGALKNIEQVVRYYQNRGKNVGRARKNLVILRKKIATCNRIEELMAIEGNARAYYYQSFDHIIEDPDFRFEKRSRRPPLNYLNTLISFGNSMLYTIILAEIYKTFLDPRIGFLHATNFRRFTLNLDVAEIFKAIIIDRVIFTLISRKMITANAFKKEVRGILLKDKAKQTFISELEGKLASTLSHPTLGRNVSYRRLIRLELYKLQKHFMAEKKYEAYVTRW